MKREAQIVAEGKPIHPGYASSAMPRKPAKSLAKHYGGDRIAGDD